MEFWEIIVEWSPIVMPIILVHYNRLLDRMDRSKEIAEERLRSDRESGKPPFHK